MVATQNPIEYQGTYPLPEAQLNRFFFKLLVDYCPAEVERGILVRYHEGFDAHRLEDLGLEPVLAAGSLGALRAECRSVTVAGGILDYITALVRASRQSRDLLLGASPRAGIALLQGSKALAALCGRDYVLPDDVKRLAAPVLRHRLLLLALAAALPIGAATLAPWTLYLAGLYLAALAAAVVVVDLRLEMPLGLLIRQYSFPISGPARVYPSLRAVRRYDLLARRGRLQEMGLRHARLSGAGTDFERLRDYLPDDDYRRIAWKATARRDPGGQGAAGSEAGFVAGWADPGAAPFWPFRRLPSGDADSQSAAALGRRPEPPAGVLPASPIFGGSRCVGGGLPPRRRLRPEAGLRSGGRGSGALSLPA